MDELSPDQKHQGWDAVTVGYENTFEGFARLFAEDILSRARPGPGSRVLDVGAGPGILTLLTAQLGADVLAIDFAPGMVDRLRSRLADEAILNACAEVMDGQDLHLADASIDYAFSNFAVIFFPNIERGLTEMHRVLKPGGQVAVTSWGAPERLGFVQALMRAVRTAIPDFPTPAKPPVWLRLSNPDFFKRCLHEVGFRNIRIETLSRDWNVPSAEWLAQNVAGLSPGLSFIFDTLGPERTQRVLDVVVTQLRDEFKNGNVRLTCEALLGIGKAGRGADVA